MQPSDLYTGGLSDERRRLLQKAEDREKRQREATLSLTLCGQAEDVKAPTRTAAVQSSVASRNEGLKPSKKLTFAKRDEAKRTGRILYPAAGLPQRGNLAPRGQATTPSSGHGILHPPQEHSLEGTVQLDPVHPASRGIHGDRRDPWWLASEPAHSYTPPSTSSRTSGYTSDLQVSGLSLSHRDQDRDPYSPPTRNHGYIHSEVVYPRGLTNRRDVYSWKGTHPVPYVVNAATDICNIFWKSSLTFHPYKCTDPCVDFGSLWPSERKVRSILFDTYRDTGLRRLLGDLCQISITCGPLRMVKAMIDLKLIGVNQVFENGQSLLHRACIAQNIDAVLYLLNCDVDTTILDKSGRWAGQVCYSNRIMKVLPEERDVVIYTGLLLEPEAYRPRLKVKSSPSLHDKQLIFDLAQNARDLDELMIKLQTLDFDVNEETDENGDYLMHLATAQGVSQVPLLSLLVKICRADINLFNKGGATCLLIATLLGNTTMVDTLLCVFGADPDVGDLGSGRTPLHVACERNDLDVTSILIKRGADFNKEDKHGARPDDLASMATAVECRDLIGYHREERMCRLCGLVERDELTPEDIRTSDLFTTNRAGHTLLGMAAQRNSWESLQWLVKEANAPINAQHEKTLKTPLAYACLWGHVESIRILLRNGANPAIRDCDKNLPLHNAVLHHQAAAVTELLGYPQALTGIYRGLEMAQHPAIRRELRQAMQRRQRDVVTHALFQFAVSGDAGALFCLLEEGDHVNPQSAVGDWPLYLAVSNGHLDVVTLLAENGGDLDRRHERTGNSLLHAACSEGDIRMVNFLLSRCVAPRAGSRLEPGGPINALNYAKQTPLVCAAEKGYLELVELLLSRGASTAVLSPTSGLLYSCSGYHGVQYVIEKHRTAHTDDVIKAISDRKAVERLREIFVPQFDHNLRSPEGDTPLMVACRLGKHDVIRFFLETAAFKVFPSPPSSVMLHLASSDREASSTGHSPDVTATLHPVSGRRQPTGSKSRSGSGSTFHIPPDDYDLEEESIKDNISSLLNSFASISRGSVFVDDKRVSHLCATSLHDGRTAFHRLLEAGDHVTSLAELLKRDESAVNIQDNAGLSPLHVACLLGRAKVVRKLTSLTFVDLNCRSLEGKLPEEMTSNKSIIDSVEKKRKDWPNTSTHAPLGSLPSSVFGAGATESDVATALDFDDINTQFLMMKQNIAEEANFFL